MRILHFSDLHIGVENYGRTDPATGLSTRLGDFLASLDQVVEYALAENVDLVLLAGDAYKGRDPSQTQQREFAKRLARLSEAGIPSFLLVGNHDLPNAVGRATAVEIFDTLRVPNVQVGSALRNYTVATRSGPLQILAVPWPRRSTLLSREDTRGKSIDEVRQEVERRMTSAIYARARELAPQVPAVIAAHLTVNGATVGTERSMMLGQDHVLMAGDLQQPQVDYVALGHIHKHQVLRTEAPMMAYSGSLQRVDFSEEGDEKGFCLVDLDPAAPQGRRLTGFEFHTLEARPFVTIETTLISGDPDPTRSLLRAIARRDVTDAVVRVRATLPPELAPHIREADLREALAPAHYIASINLESSQETRRTRLAAGEAEGLQPMQALRLYLENRDIDPGRRERMVQLAQEIVDAED